MTTTYASIVMENQITLFVDGHVHAITSDHPNYSDIREAVKNENYEKAASLIDIAVSIENFGGDRVTVDNGVVMYDGVGVHNTLTDRILAMMREGFNINPMLSFLENLMDNPSKRAVDELYGFLAETDLPITADGQFIAYKMVRDDYTDHYTGKMDNSVGAKPSMPRNQVNDDKESTCSDGLHFCSQGYLGCYASNGRTVILKVNPRDVVSIPVDYNFAKGRACLYEIIGEIEGGIAPKSHSFDTSVYGDGTVFGADSEMPGFDEDGFDEDGFDEDGFDADGYDIYGFDADCSDSNKDEENGSDDVVLNPIPRRDDSGFELMPFNQAAEALCGNTKDPKSALRKRLARGISVTEENGMVRVPKRDIK